MTNGQYNCKKLEKVMTGGQLQRLIHEVKICMDWDLLLHAIGFNY